MSVERRHQDPARDVVHAAMDQVAAGHRHGAVVLYGRIPPLDGPALLCEVDGVHVVGVRAVHVHRRVDDQGLPLVAAQRARRERPHLAEIRDVVGGDLIQRAVARRRVVLPRQHPLVVIGLPRHQIVVGGDCERQPQRQSRDDADASLHGLVLSLAVPERRGRPGRATRTREWSFGRPASRPNWCPGRGLVGEAPAGCGLEQRNATSRGRVAVLSGSLNQSVLVPFLQLHVEGHQPCEVVA